MSALDEMDVDAVVLQLLEAVVEERVSLQDLTKAAGLDPSKAFIGASLRDIDLRDEDLRAFDFSGADLTGSDFRRANIAGVRFSGSIRHGATGLPDFDSEYSDGIVRIFEVENTRGLHARASAKVVSICKSLEVSAQFSTLNEPEIRVSGESIMGLMMLGAGSGTLLRVDVGGARAEEALDCIARVLFDGELIYPKE